MPALAELEEEPKDWPELEMYLYFIVTYRLAFFKFLVERFLCLIDCFDLRIYP